MNPRVATIMRAPFEVLAVVILLLIVGFGLGNIIIPAKQPTTAVATTSSAEVHIRWAASPLPPCSSTVTTHCVISLNILAFNPDGSVLVVANKLAPDATSTVALVPEGITDFWLVVSIHDDSGDFTVSQPSTLIFDIPDGSPVEPTPADDDDKPRDEI